MVRFGRDYFLEISASIYCFECFLQQVENFERHSLAVPVVREAPFFSTFDALPA